MTPGDVIHANIVGTYELLAAARQYWAALSAADKAKASGKSILRPVNIFNTRIRSMPNRSKSCPCWLPRMAMGSIRWGC